MKKIKYLRPIALAALGVFLGRGAQADTILDFDVLPNQVANNDVVAPTFGDAVSASSDSITVAGFGTPNIGLTWQGTGGTWQHYVDSVWAAVQLDSSGVGDRHELVFTPNNPAAAVVIKSFNFHPYYLCDVTSCERFTYDVSVLADAAVVSGPTNITFASDSTKNHPVSINYTGSIGQTLTLRLARVASALSGIEVEGSPGDIAVDDITFAQSPETTFLAGPLVIAVTPAADQFAPPDHYYVATIADGITHLKKPSVRLRLNGTLVSTTVSGAGGMNTVSYQAAGLLAAGSTNLYRLTYSDDAGPANDFTNDVQFVVASYVNKQLPAPIVFENFNSTAEGGLPAGWTVTNLNTLPDPTSEPFINFTNLDSAAYTNWTVVDAARFTGTFDTYSQLYNSQVQPVGEAEDYRRVLSVNPSNVVNGAFVRNLASGRFIFGNSGYRNDSLGQVMYLFSPDFNLTGRTNIHLSFHSLWEQNQDSIAAVEYSTDMGTNWFPIVYMLDDDDVATNLNGSVNALTTFTNIDTSGTAHWIDGVVTNGGYYGAFIGVASNQWSTLAPYISKRLNDNPVESKRVEIFRLPRADNQPKVRLRFAHAGTDAWYFGVDDVGLYSLPTLKISSIVRSGTNAILSWPAELNTKLQKATSLTSPGWQDVSGSTGASSATNAITGAEAYYRLVRPY